MSEITKKSEDQKGAEAEVEGFRKNLGPFVVAAETTRMAMVFKRAISTASHVVSFAIYDVAEQTYDFPPSLFGATRHRTTAQF